MVFLLLNQPYYLYGVPVKGKFVKYFISSLHYKVYLKSQYNNN